MTLRYTLNIECDRCGHVEYSIPLLPRSTANELKRQVHRYQWAICVYSTHRPHRHLCPLCAYLTFSELEKKIKTTAFLIPGTDPNRLFFITFFSSAKKVKKNKLFC
jgi:hypothetical protein